MARAPGLLRFISSAIMKQPLFRAAITRPRSDKRFSCISRVLKRAKGVLGQSGWFTTDGRFVHTDTTLRAGTF